MELNSEVVQYVLTWHRDLMTATEMKALDHLIATAYKSWVERSDERAVWELRGRKFLRMLSDVPKVLSLLKAALSGSNSRLWRESLETLRTKYRLTAVHDAAN